MSRKSIYIAVTMLLICVTLVAFCGCGDDAENGENRIVLSTIELVKTEGLVDTYELTFSNGERASFTATNGKDGIGIEDVVVKDGNLIVYLSQGDPIDLGKVVGDKGESGQNGVSIVGASLNAAGELVLTLSDDTRINVGSVKGQTGQNGAPGRSAFEIYRDTYGYDGTEEEWLKDLVCGNLSTIEHTVTFDLNDGKSPLATQTVGHCDKVEKPQDPVRDGWIFEGWFCEGEKWSFAGYAVTDDIVLEAKWAKIPDCEITEAPIYEMGSIEVDGQIVSTMFLEVGYVTESFDLTNTVFVPEGCSWNVYDATSKEEVGKVLVALNEGDNRYEVVVENGTSAKSYHLNVYRRHMYDFTFKDVGGIIDEGVAEEGSLIVEEPVPEEPEGYEFSHWTVDGVEVELPYEISSDTVFEAAYAPKINTLIIMGDTDGELANETIEMQVATGQTIVLPDNEFVKPGYTFESWLDLMNGMTRYKEGDRYTMGTSSTAVLVAVWSPNTNRLSFDKNSSTATGEMTSIEIDTDRKADLPPVGFVNEGFDFVGWATTPDGEAVYGDGASYTMGVESEVTLYAVWKPSA